MLVTFWPIFVADTKIIFRYNSAAPLISFFAVQRDYNGQNDKILQAKLSFFIGY